MVDPRPALARTIARPHLPERICTQLRRQWAFIQTLRHLNFASAAGGPHGAGAPLAVASRGDCWGTAPAIDGMPCDLEATPTLDEVLAIRRERQAMVSRVMAELTEEQLASTVSRAEPGWPGYTDFPFHECLRTVLGEEWEHRRYAERDLTRLEQEVTHGAALPLNRLRRTTVPPTHRSAEQPRATNRTRPDPRCRPTQAVSGTGRPVDGANIRITDGERRRALAILRTVENRSKG